MQSKPIFVEQYDFNKDSGQITIWHDGTSEVRDVVDFSYYCYKKGLYSLGSKQASAMLTLTQMPAVAKMIVNNWINEPADESDDIFSGPDVTEVDMGKVSNTGFYDLPEAALPPGVRVGSYEHNQYNMWMATYYGYYGENN